MIESLEIRNFQSHTNTVLPLKKFTVVVGPSSSGKSAIVRAFKTLTSNARGKDFITHGELTTTIKATTDRGTVVLTKGKPEDSYVIISKDDPKNPKRFTKLGGEVPAEVSQLLGIPAKDAVNYARDQFEPPFLLRSSPAEVARVLGELTNVSVVFDAAREGNRKKLAGTQLLKTRQVDVQKLEPRIPEFQSLKERQAALETAEDSLARAHMLNGQLERLTTAVSKADLAQKRLAQAHTKAAPDLNPLLFARDSLARFNELLGFAMSSKTNIKNATLHREELAISLDDNEAELYVILLQAGTCPTCGSTIEEKNHEHTHPE